MLHQARWLVFVAALRDRKRGFSQISCDSMAIFPRFVLVCGLVNHVYKTEVMMASMTPVHVLVRTAA